MNAKAGNDLWPSLPQSAWSETCETLQLWTQIVGKIRLALTPHLNHTWNVTLYPTARGLTTSTMWSGTTTLQIDFDFTAHVLVILTSQGGQKSIPLEPMTVATFYRKIMGALNDLSIPVRIWPIPMEVAEPVPFDQDLTHKAYDAEYVERFWGILLQTTRIFNIFRAGFTGKVSPVHLFWGAFDLACTRFSGRIAPEHPSMEGLPDRVTRDAYSHEVSSCGFWPGTAGIEPLFYSYAYPQPEGYAEAPIRPVAARFDPKLGEFVLPYDKVRESADPEASLLDFLETTYAAAANTTSWDRQALEYPIKPSSV